MFRWRLSEPARADIASILRTSEATHGAAARTRCRGLLSAALRRIAADPTAVPTVDRGELADGLRSLHLRHCRRESREAPVGAPVHVVFYRLSAAGPVEIVRVLHERMEPGRHFGPHTDDEAEGDRFPP